MTIQNQKDTIVALLEDIFQQIKNNDIKGVNKSIELANSLISTLPGARKDQSRYEKSLTDLERQKEATVANKGNTEAWTDNEVWMSYKNLNQTGFDYIVLSNGYDIDTMTSVSDTELIKPASMPTDSTYCSALMTEVASNILDIHFTYTENNLQQSVRIQVAAFMAWLSNPNRDNFSHQYNNLMSQVERTMVRALNTQSAQMIQTYGNQEKKTILPLTKDNVAAEQEKQSTVLNNKNISNALEGLQLLFILFQVSRLMYAFNSINTLGEEKKGPVDNTAEVPEQAAAQEQKVVGVTELLNNITEKDPSATEQVEQGQAAQVPTDSVQSQEDDNVLYNLFYPNEVVTPENVESSDEIKLRQLISLKDKFVPILNKLINNLTDANALPKMHEQRIQFLINELENHTERLSSANDSIQIGVQIDQLIGRLDDANNEFKNEPDTFWYYFQPILNKIAKCVIDFSRSVSSFLNRAPVSDAEHAALIDKWTVKPAANVIFEMSQKNIGLTESQKNLKEALQEEKQKIDGNQAPGAGPNNS